MSDFVERHDDLVRRSRDAATRLRRAARRIHSFRGSGPGRVLASIEAETLLGVVLDAAETLVDCLDETGEYCGEDELGELERAASSVRSALRRRRLAVKLDQAAGRTAPEAATFAAKAEELRS